MCEETAGEIAYWLRGLAREGVQPNRVHVVDMVHALDHAGLTALHDQLAGRPDLRAAIAGVLRDAEQLGALPAAHASRHPGTCDKAAQSVGWAVHDVDLCRPGSGRTDRAEAVAYLAGLIAEDYTELCDLAVLHDQLAARPALLAEVAALARIRTGMAT